MLSLYRCENERGTDKMKGKPRLGTMSSPPNATLLSLTISLSSLSWFLNTCRILNRLRNRMIRFTTRMTNTGTIRVKTNCDRVLSVQDSSQSELLFFLLI